MDRMKTVIMKIILRRARNYMKNMKEDAKKEQDRLAIADFLIVFRTDNIFHSNHSKSSTGPSESVKAKSEGDQDAAKQAKPDQTRFAPEAAALVLGTTPTVLSSLIGPNGTFVSAAKSVCDNVDDGADGDLRNWIKLFEDNQNIGGCTHERLTLSCVPRNPS